MVRQDYHLSERFEVAFNQIHDSLRSIIKIKDDRFKVLLNIGARKHKMIGKFYNELTQYAKLRNSLVHDKRELGYYIAEPHIDVVERIEKISSVFNKPNYALSIATRNVVTLDCEDSMLDVIQEIRKHGYSQYPIYQNKHCVGLLKTVDIVSWMSKNVINTMVDLTDIKVRDIISDVKEHPIEYVPKSIDIFSVEDLYENKHKDKVKLEAVIITGNGKNNEKPLGLVTAWDLIEIDYTAD
ncbi:CBS domain-containing protein [Oceanobacillus halophilus]|uniref:CBS domain-containing protein n=2 Tax=Oceanobacillus halophilus TaxID=930130 RepID=A0A494ZTM6_9BACI|nr:CBS domain-containing protein [Oceanobacillus halophilus]